MKVSKNSFMSKYRVLRNGKEIREVAALEMADLVSQVPVFF